MNRIYHISFTKSLLSDFERNNLKLLFIPLLPLGTKSRNFSTGWTETMMVVFLSENLWAKKPPWRKFSRTWTRMEMAQ